MVIFVVEDQMQLLRQQRHAAWLQRQQQQQPHAWQQQQQQPHAAAAALPNFHHDDDDDRFTNNCINAPACLDDPTTVVTPGHHWNYKYGPIQDDDGPVVGKWLYRANESTVNQY